MTTESELTESVAATVVDDSDGGTESKAKGFAELVPQLLTRAMVERPRTIVRRNPEFNTSRLQF
jgi:hypothetical protein